MSAQVTTQRVIKFGITGALGALTNLLLFYLGVEIVGAPPLPMAAICHVLAASQNYVINHYWTFPGAADTPHISWRSWFLFLIGSLLALLVNLILLKFTLDLMPSPIYAQACGIAAGFVINYLVARAFIFNK